MGFIAIAEALNWLNAHHYVVVTCQQLLLLYPIKTAATASVLIYYRKSYSEINWRDVTSPRQLGMSMATGILVFILWVNMDWHWATISTSTGYDPTGLSDNFTRLFLISSRIIGASILVPIMEELFWRSWLLRYLVDQDIKKVPIGTFTWVSFIIGSIMFGLEHNLWLAGIMAGTAYSLLLYRTKSIASCIAAHAVTNGLLAGYVLWSGKWAFW
jgi:CAAX prenyl protease-like protein